MDMQNVASEYLHAQHEKEVLKERIRRIDAIHGESVSSSDLPSQFAQAENAVTEIVSNWKLKLMRFEMITNHYELAVNRLTPRERMVLKLHFEEKHSFREIVKMNLSLYGIDHISLSTLSRDCKRIESKFETQWENDKFVLKQRNNDANSNETI